MTKSIRALDRGLVVLEMLDRQGATSLADLSRATSLSKATLLRVLQTLVERGWAYRRVNDGCYTLAIAPGSRDPAGIQRTQIARIGESILRTLSQITGFPADLTIVVEPGILEVIESTRTRIEGGVDPFVAGFRPSLVFSSPGRALLAACDEPSRQTHLEHILRTDSPAERFFITSGALTKEIRRTTERGYAIRESGYWPDSSDYGEEPMDIAVPIGRTDEPVGCISIVWPTSQHQLEEVVTKHFANLKLVAEELSQSIY